MRHSKVHHSSKRLKAATNKFRTVCHKVRVQAVTGTDLPNAIAHTSVFPALLASPSIHRSAGAPQMNGRHSSASRALPVLDNQTERSHRL